MKLLRSPIVSIAWLTFITIAFLLPGAAIPKINWADKLLIDKWAHWGIFAVTVFIWCYMLINKSTGTVRRITLFVAIGALIYGVLIEIVQSSFVPNRSFDAWDIAADAAGCITGVLISRRYIKK